LFGSEVKATGPEPNLFESVDELKRTLIYDNKTEFGFGECFAMA
jgi:hypothetical protein